MAFSLIHNATLIDGRGGHPVPKAAVLVEDNRIHAVGPAAQVKRPAGDVTEIDAQGGWILPGLIDTHVHIMLEGVSIARDLQTPFSMRFYNAVNYLRRTLDAGVTTVRDAGGADLGTKAAVEKGVVAGPRLQISVSVLTITGGHGDGWMPSGGEFELFRPYPGFPDGRADGVEEVRKKVREVLRAGADVVKICATGGVLSPTDHPEFTQYSPEELDVIVREAAYRRGVKVMAHAQGLEGIKNAVRAGIHSIEHGIYLDDEVDRHDVGARHLPRAHAAGPAGGGRGGRGGRHARIRAAQGAGGNGGAHGEHRTRARGGRQDRDGHGRGGDAPRHEPARARPHGQHRHDAHAKHRGDDAGGRKCLGWDDRLGTVEAGKLADIVISRTDPLADIRSLEKLENIALVMQDGKVVKDRRV